MELILLGGAELWHLTSELVKVELHPFMKGSFMPWLAANSSDWT